MNTYTKREWKRGTHSDEPFARSEFKIFRDYGRCIVEIKREGFMRIEEAEANAQLIVSAPDLYEALKACLNWLNETHPEELYWRNLLSEALAKAEGKKHTTQDDFVPPAGLMHDNGW